MSSELSYQALELIGKLVKDDDVDTTVPGKHACYVRDSSWAIRFCPPGYRKSWELKVCAGYVSIESAVSKVFLTGPPLQFWTIPPGTFLRTILEEFLSREKVETMRDIHLLSGGHCVHDVLADIYVDRFPCPLCARVETVIRESLKGRKHNDLISGDADDDQWKTTKPSVVHCIVECYHFHRRQDDNAVTLEIYFNKGSNFETDYLTKVRLGGCPHRRITCLSTRLPLSRPGSLRDEDLRMDVFRFLTRNELDIGHLVHRSWNHFIHKDSHLLPLRRISYASFYTRGKTDRDLFADITLYEGQSTQPNPIPLAPHRWFKVMGDSSLFNRAVRYHLRNSFVQQANCYGINKDCVEDVVEWLTAMSKGLENCRIEQWHFYEEISRSRGFLGFLNASHDCCGTREFSFRLEVERVKRFCRERSFFNAVAIQAARALEFVLTSKPEENPRKRLATRVVVPPPYITKHKVFWFDDVFHLPNCDKLTIYYDTNQFEPKDVGQVVGDVTERLLREPKIGFPKELRLVTRSASPQLLVSQLQPTYKEIDLAHAEWPLDSCYAWNVYHLESRASTETFTLLADVEHKHYWLRRGTIEFEQRTLKRRACCGHRRKVMLWVEVGASVSPQSSDGSSCSSASSEEEDSE